MPVIGFLQPKPLYLIFTRDLQYVITTSNLVVVDSYAEKYDVNIYQHNYYSFATKNHKYKKISGKGPEWMLEDNGAYHFLVSRHQIKCHI
jgi:hypothetical protein